MPGKEGRVGEWVGWVVRLERCFYASPARLYGTFRLQLLRATYHSAIQVCNTIILSANLFCKRFSSLKLTFVGRDRSEERPNTSPREQLFFENILIKDFKEVSLALYIKGSFWSKELCTTLKLNFYCLYKFALVVKLCWYNNKKEQVFNLHLVLNIINFYGS